MVAGDDDGDRGGTDDESVAEMMNRWRYGGGDDGFLDG